MSTVVFAPDSFKGSATAAEVASALAAGWSSVRSGDRVVLAPMADGGEGTLDAFEVAVPGAERRPVRVTGPDGEARDASWLLLPDGTAVVELADTSGIVLMPRLAPYDAQTTGFGQAIAAALDAGATGLLLAIGGSASTDGGAGMLSALGARLLDADGAVIGPGNRGLAELHRAETGPLRTLPAGGARILSDVTSPLLGPAGAAAVFGPQKGATAADVPVLEAGLARLARVLREAGVDVDPAAPGAGAAGGTGFGLLAWGATMAPGSAAVGEALGLAAALTSADAVVTGEGRYDDQSAAGKVPEYVAGLARDAGIPAFLAAGSIAAEPRGFAGAASLSDLAGGSAAAITDPLRWAAAAGAELARRWPG
ncbi:glycerate kinase [Leifsonia shinshuensis]|uniref:Glycerate kinase n=1 Tax=Leifsonia shinshuensis TaxID=150026 RepID=A0A7G6Y9U6_9MICO|nr:glycerate kinase [Leifsonia shinshuensis]QNE35261.1 glycerate kinase [Leifsonia shinshuensis]